MTRDDDGSWAEAQAHLLAQPMSERLRAWIASDTPYRPVYGGPEHGPRTHPRVPEPWKALREEQPFVFGSAGPGELALAWLMRKGVVDPKESKPRDEAPGVAHEGAGAHPLHRSRERAQ